jgi:transcriptional regulator GlxA family with amidase domain
MIAVAVLALHGVVPLDLSIASDGFSRPRLPDGRDAYRVRVCGPEDEVSAGLFGVRVEWGLDELARADTIVVPGTAEPLAPSPPAVLDALRDAAAAGCRIASICTGAFVLAEAGLLDGRRATTHWRGTTDLARLHPAVDVDPDVLFVDDGPILTSAGAAAGLDLCLHMIRADHGAAVAAAAARDAVMPLERPGGQSQFIAHEPPTPSGSSLAPVLAWLEEHLDEDLDVDDIAAAAMMSSRTLTRQFRRQTGTTPLQWLLRTRIRAAQGLLETTDLSVARVARRTGFASPATFRDRFRRIVGVGPQRYREAFRARAAPPAPTAPTSR